MGDIKYPLLESLDLDFPFSEVLTFSKTPFSFSATHPPHLKSTETRGAETALNDWVIPLILHCLIGFSCLQVSIPQLLSFFSAGKLAKISQSAMPENINLPINLLLKAQENKF